MNSKNLWRVLAVHAMVLCLFAGCSQNDNAPSARTGRDVVDSMRLKQLTKALQLTQEQQEQVKPLLAAESKQVEAVNADTTLSVDDRFNRYKEFRDATYGKIRSLLTPEQTPQLDALIAQSEGKKKKR